MLEEIAQSAGLTNLATILGRHGALKGVTVEAGDGGQGVKVRAVDGAGPAGGKLKKDDVIEGIVEGENLKPFATPRAYYEGVADVRPGREVTLRVHAPGAKPRDVALPVGQATDERKPLLSLFVTRAARAADREWVGWNPYGPYEASGPRAERLIAWHFNTGLAAGPARVALAREYRTGRYREGIIKHLLAQGSVNPAIEAWEKEERAKPAPRPNMGLDFSGAEDPEADAQGRVLVRRPPPALRLRVDGGFPEDRVGAVRWRLVPDGAGGKPAEGEMKPVSDRWEADLAGVTWERKDYTLDVRLQTREAEPKDYSRRLTIRYRPAAPGLKLDAWLEKHFKKPVPQLLGNTVSQPLQVQLKQFTVEAEVSPGVPGEGMKVFLRQDDKPPKELPVEHGTVKEEVELAEGDNRLELAAVNKDAPPEDKEPETSRVVLVLTHVPPAAKVPPPSIILAAVEETAEGREQPVVAGRPLTVGSAVVRIRGKVVAREDLAEVTCGEKTALPALGASTVGLLGSPHGQGPLLAASALFPGRAEKTLDVGAAKELDIDEKVTLEKTGRNEVRFRARTKSGQAAVTTLELEFRPQLPEVVWVTPAPDSVFYGEPAPKVTVTARLIESPGGHKYTATLLHNGKELTTPEPAGRTLTASVTLKNGENRLRLKLANEWRREALSDELVVRFARPPHDIKFAEPRLDPKKPLADLSATVETPVDLLPKTVEATLNGRALPPTEVAVVGPNKEGQTWRVTFKNVPLAEGANRVELAVSNAEGRSRRPGLLTFDYKRAAAPRPPEVTILSPAGEGLNVTSPDVPLRFRVRSAAPLKHLALVREGLAPFRQPFDVSGLKAGEELVVSASLVPRAVPPGGPAAIDPTKAPLDREGARELTLGFPLEPKDNRLRVEAVSEGGGGYAEVLVNYLPAPVRVVFDALVDPSSTPRVKQAERRPGGRVFFPAAGDARVELYGRVVWDESKDARLRQPRQQVRVYVNGFQQSPADLLPALPGTRERKFQARLVLSRDKDNVVEVDLPAEDGQEVNSRPQFLVDCKEPLRQQRLYLLIISPTEQDQKKLEKRALEAFKTPAFVEPITRVLTGKDVTDSNVFGRLGAIGKQIARGASAGATNDLVMVYYAGDEKVSGEGHYLTGGRDDPNLTLSGISCDGLAKFFPHILGAQILLLDVARLPGAGGERQDKVVAWPPEVRTGVFRAARLQDVPAEARVLTAWQKTVPGASRLKEVDSGVADLFHQILGARASALRYDKNVPYCLEDMRVGKP